MNPRSREYGKGFVVALLIGCGVMLYGTWGLLDNAQDTNPTEWIMWFLGALVAHDLVVAPLVFLVGWLLSRTFSPSTRAPIQAGFIASAIVIAVTWPLLRRYGANDANPSALPNDYTTGLLSILSLIWTAALLSVGWKLRAARRRRRAHEDPAT